MRLLLGILFFLLAHIITWFQLNGQFMWEWFKNNTFILALLGIPVSYLYIWATKYTVAHYEGLLWPSRFIGFGVGIVIYAILVYQFFSEGISMKTLISLLLAISIIFVQIFWK